MKARIDLMSSPVGKDLVKELVRAARVPRDSGLPTTTLELINVRASQINGCGYCLDMHTKDATEAGESVQRLHLVAVWREATVFSDAERAALALTEEATRLADSPGGVSDEVWQEVRRHFDEDQTVALVAQLALINAFNRLNVTLRNPAGSYQPGQWS